MTNYVECTVNRNQATSLLAHHILGMGIAGYFKSGVRITPAEY